MDKFIYYKGYLISQSLLYNEIWLFFSYMTLNNNLFGPVKKTQITRI